jgi:hypothetical protein
LAAFSAQESENAAPSNPPWLPATEDFLRPSIMYLTGKNHENATGNTTSRNRK